MSRKLRIMTLVCLSISCGIVSSQASSAQQDPTGQAAYEKASKSVYTLYGNPVGGQSPVLGNAVAIGTHLLASNCHVALTNKNISVRVKGQNKKANLIYHYEEADICILGVDEASLDPVKIRPSSLVQIGEDVATVDNDGKQKTISKAKVSTKYAQATIPATGFDPTMKYIAENNNLAILQIDSPVSHGSGGSGLFDQKGNLIGIITEDDVEGKNQGYAIPSELILKLFPPANHDGVTRSDYTTPAPKTTLVAVTPDTSTHMPAGMQVAGNVSTPHFTRLGNNAPALPEIKITKLGSFGEDNLGAYKTSNDCFISMSGTDSQNTRTSLALWFPTEPNYIYIFPQTTRVEDAYKIFQAYDDQDATLDESNTDLLLSNKTYTLYGDAEQKDHYPILVRKLDINPVNSFLGDPDFMVQIQDASASAVHYSLHGFGDALDVESSACLR